VESVVSSHAATSYWLLLPPDHFTNQVGLLYWQIAASIIMIDLYTFTTPNGRKASIMLEEVSLPYNVHKIDISKNDQFTPEYIAINPNSKIPAIIDQDTGITVFESGAILIYLAEKTGKLLPTEQKSRFQVLEWLMLQMGSVGPMFGQLNHFKRYAPEKIPYAIARYEKETLSRSARKNQSM